MTASSSSTSTYLPRQRWLRGAVRAVVVGGVEGGVAYLVDAADGCECHTAVDGRRSAAIVASAIDFAIDSSVCFSPVPNCISGTSAVPAYAHLYFCRTICPLDNAMHMPTKCNAVHMPTRRSISSRKCCPPQP